MGDYEQLALGALLDLDSEVIGEINPCTKNLQPNVELNSLQSVGKYYVPEASDKCGLRLNKKSNGFQESNHLKANPPFTDPVFGLRIIDPLISSSLLMERMAGRTTMTFSELSRNFTQSDMGNEWVISGVILTKEVKNNSKTGKPFTIWKLSDLRGDIKTLSLLLFQNAHDDLWKTTSGTCVAVLSPSVIEKKNTDDVACLSINSAKKVLLLGTSKDMGICKAKKSNGEGCKKFVNKNECDFCIYHVEREFKKMARPVTMQQLKRHDMYTRPFGNVKSSPSYKTSKLLQRDKLLMNTLQASAESRSTTSFVKSDKPPQIVRPGPASKCETDTNQRINDLQRLKTLRSELNTATSSTTDSSFKSFGNVSTKDRAIDIVKKSPIEKIDPNSTRGSRAGKRRAAENLNIQNSPKKQKSEKVPGMEKIIGTVSAHMDLIDFRQKQEEDKYFSKLEKKEAMEDKMLNTLQVPCKAVICNTCKYAAFSAAERCKDGHHTLKVIDAVKRFFECKDCGNRTTTLFKLPKMSCSKCKGSSWLRCGMVRDRSTQNFSKELSVRGDEEKFLGSACKPNINLLLPL